MTDKERNVGFWDNAKLWWEKKKPSTSKHALTGASYKLEDVGPFAVDLSGAPVYKKTLAFLSLIVGFVVYWFWYGWVNTGFIDYRLLEQMTWGAFAGGVCVIISIITMLIDYHKGSFSKYKRILELRLRTLDRQPIKRIELKFEDHHELYNPVTGAYWRNLETSRKAAEAADQEKEARLQLADIEKAFRTQPELAGVLEAKDAEVEDLKAKVAKLEEAFIPIELDDQDMPFAKLEGKRFHSIQDMKLIIDMALGQSESIKTKDEVKGVLELKRRFVDLAEKIRLPFFVTLGECDSKGGRVYPLIISEHSLFGGSSGEGSFVEFREHTLAQRTWAGIMSKENVRAGVGEGVELGMYKFYELVPDEFALSGKKEEKMLFAPIIFVTASDAQAEKMIENFRYNKVRPDVVQQDLIDASVIYDNSVADELFETQKLVVSRLKRKEKSEEARKEDSDYESKETINRGLEKSLIVERAGDGGRFRNIKLFSKQSMKMLFYCVCFIGVFFLVFYLLHYYAGIDVGWLFPEGTTPGNDTVTDDPWGNIISPLRSWFA
jgi:hypothetical protein